MIEFLDEKELSELVRLRESDPDYLVEVLSISSEELIDKFEDRVIKYLRGEEEVPNE